MRKKVVLMIAATLVATTFVATGCSTDHPRVAQQAVFVVPIAQESKKSQVFAEINRLDSESMSLGVRGAIPQELLRIDTTQTRPLALYSKYLSGPGASLIMESEDGASSLRVTIWAQRQSGFALVLDEKSKFGYDIVNIDGESDKEVVVTGGDLHGRKWSKIFKYNGEIFDLIEEFESDKFIQYSFDN